MREWDFYSGAPASTPTRKTTATYLTSSSYINLNIADRISTVSVLTSGNSLVAQTNFTYDSGPLTSISNVTHHDDVNYGINASTRGNLTQVSHWLNTTNGWINETYTYDTLGNQRSVTDPRNNATTYDYTDDPSGCSTAVTYAYPTTITSPLNQQHKTKYYPCTGLVQSSRDQNDINNGRNGTVIAYDSMGRKTSVTYANGGETDYSYPVATTVQESQLLTGLPAVWKTSYTYFDPLGRVTQIRKIDATYGDVYIDTSYDSVGRVYCVSNPHRSTLSSTDGLTCYNYDALGRVIAQIQPDNSSIQTSYPGNCSIVSDEAGKQRKSCTDAFGRITQVLEPDPNNKTSLIYETDYQYDLNGNLLRVDQKGNDSNPANWRTRTFAYDSLSRLLCAANPEVGSAPATCPNPDNGTYTPNTIRYTYDANNNLILKTDPRGITINYSPSDSPIDALNRVTKKTYSDSTPSVVYMYDVTNPWWTATNIIGRLSTTRVFQGATEIANSAFSYDPMGGVIHQGQYAGSLAADFVATYDLAGNVSTLSYPSGRYLKYSYDAANRLNSVNVDSFGGTYIGYSYYSVGSANACPSPQSGFYPNGSPAIVSYGNLISESRCLNSRLQPSGTLFVGHFGQTTQTMIDRSYTYSDGGFNNGNVGAITDNLWNRQHSTDNGRSQYFLYDALNRITTGVEGATSNVGRWGQSYGIDAWGNLSNISIIKGSATPLVESVGSNNRFTSASPCVSTSPTCYDAAGNLIQRNGRAYVFNAENQISAVKDSASGAVLASYTYGSDGQRIRKVNGSDVTEYFYFGGQAITEKKANGDWSDYIYAGAQRIAKADSFEDRLHITGANCSNCGSQYSLFALPSSSNYAGYVIQTGDRLLFRQYQSGGAHGGMQVAFANGTNTNWGASDSDGNILNNDGVQQSWHFRNVDLSPYVGRTISAIYFVQESTTSAGTWHIYYNEIAMLSADGTIRPIYSRQTSISLSMSGSSGVSGRTYNIEHLTGLGSQAAYTTSFIHADHLSSSRLTTTYNGYPIWQGTYLPYGEEYDKEISNNHYQFTGKERDSETGLDDFGARYYASLMGRFMIPDWSAKIEAVPYSKLDNPQSLNLYSYVLNNPISNVDTDGHACSSYLGNTGSGFCTRATEYGKFDANPSIQSQTRFFGAANAVSQALADVAVPLASRFVVSQQTASFLEAVGQSLEKLNQAEAGAIQNGTLSGPNLDQQLVHNEQSAVQSQLDTLQQSNPAAYRTTISEINAALNPGSVGQFASTQFSTDKAYARVLGRVRRDLGRNIDFSKQSDREAIGNALIDHIRETGGCDVNGKKQSGC
jgi:RHS repeat-associated protein